MKLDSNDISTLRSGLQACKLADIEQAVIFGGLIRGTSTKETAVIFSPMPINVDRESKIGIGRVPDLEKRLNLMGDAGASIEGEVGADEVTIKKLVIKAPSGKVEFRCQAVGSIKHPKNTPEDLRDLSFPHDPVVAVLTFKREDAALIIRAAKTMSTTHLTMQVKADGQVNFECYDATNDVFKTTLSTVAEFEDEPLSKVHTYAADSSGVITALLDSATRDVEETKVKLMRSGLLGFTVLNHYILALPSADHEE